MILVDTSAWIEYLRGTGSLTNVALRKLIDHGEPVFTTDVVVAELLAGEPDPKRHDRLRRFLLHFELLGVRGLHDWEQAADLLRRCRAAGETRPTLTECLISAVAIRHGATLLHHDAIARHAPLQIER